MDFEAIAEVGGVRFTWPQPGGTGPGPTPDPPVLSGITPAPGVPRGRFDRVGFSVTNGPELVVAVFAFFPNSGAYEVIYDSEGFAPAYGTSTIQVIEGGYRFELERVAGWPVPDTLRLRLLVRDAAGNTLTLES